MYPTLRSRSWANLFNRDALTKLVPTLLSCLAMILTLERFSHPLALPSGAHNLKHMQLPRAAGMQLRRQLAAHAPVPHLALPACKGTLSPALCLPPGPQSCWPSTWFSTWPAWRWA